MTKTDFIQLSLNRALHAIRTNTVAQSRDAVIDIGAGADLDFDAIEAGILAYDGAINSMRPRASDYWYPKH